MLSRSSLRTWTFLAAVGVSTASCSDGTAPRAAMLAVAGTYWAGTPSTTSVLERVP